MNNTRTSAKQLRMREQSLQEEKKERKTSQFNGYSMNAGNAITPVTSGMAKQINFLETKNLLPLSSRQGTLPFVHTQTGSSIGENYSAEGMSLNCQSSNFLDEETLDFDDNSALHKILNSSDLVSHFEPSQTTSSTQHAPLYVGRETSPLLQLNLSGDLSSDLISPTQPSHSGSLHSDADQCLSLSKDVSPLIRTSFSWTAQPILSQSSDVCTNQVKQNTFAAQPQVHNKAQPIRIISGTCNRGGVSYLLPHTGNAIVEQSHVGSHTFGQATPCAGGMLEMRNPNPSQEPTMLGSSLKVSSSCPAHLSQANLRPFGASEMHRQNKVGNSSLHDDVPSQSRPTSINVSSTLLEEKSSITGSSGISTCTQATPPLRDRQKKDSHNRVERRRRDIINQNIEILGDLVPQDFFRDTDGKKHKGTILSAAVNYIAYLRKQEETHRFMKKEVSYAIEAVSALIEREEMLQNLVEKEGPCVVNTEAVQHCKESIHRLLTLQHQQPGNAFLQQNIRHSVSSTNPVSPYVAQPNRFSFNRSPSWKVILTNNGPTSPSSNISTQLTSCSAPVRGGLGFTSSQPTTFQMLYPSIKQEPQLPQIHQNDVAKMELEDVLSDG